MTTEPTSDVAAQPPDDRRLWDALLGLFVCPAVLVARDLGLYSLLKDRACTREEVREALAIPRRGLEGLLAVHVASGLLSLSGDRVALTPLSRAYLVEGSPTYFGGFLDLIAMGAPMYGYEGLKRAITTDKPQMYGGADLFESHAERADLARKFTRAMHGMSAASSTAWPDACDLSSHRRLLDIGGGSGAHAAAAVERWADLEAVVFDLAPVCEVAEELIGARGLGARVRMHAGDIWKDPYPSADVHLYSMIFHDWPLHKCEILARKSHASLPADGLIVVHEMLYDDDKSGPLSVAAFSLSMLFGTEGEQYSGREIGRTLSEAGFADIRTVPTFGYWSIVTGRKAK